MSAFKPAHIQIHLKPISVNDKRRVIERVEALESTPDAPLFKAVTTTTGKKNRTIASLTQALIVAALQGDLGEEGNFLDTWWFDDRWLNTVVEPSETTGTVKEIYAELWKHAFGCQSMPAHPTRLVSPNSRTGKLSYNGGGVFPFVFYEDGESLNASRLVEIATANSDSTEWKASSQEAATLKRWGDRAIDLDFRPWVRVDRRKLAKLCKSELLSKQPGINSSDRRASMDMELATQALRRSGNPHTQVVGDACRHILDHLRSQLPKEPTGLACLELREQLLGGGAEDLLTPVIKSVGFSLARDLALEWLGSMNPEILDPLDQCQIGGAEIEVDGTPVKLQIHKVPWPEGFTRRYAKLYPAPNVALIPQEEQLVRDLLAIDSALALKGTNLRADFRWTLDGPDVGRIETFSDPQLASHLLGALQQYDPLKLVKPKFPRRKTISKNTSSVSNKAAVPGIPISNGVFSNLRIPKPNPHFAGAHRVRDLLELRSLIDPNARSLSSPHAYVLLWGDGGVGKTEAARKLAHDWFRQPDCPFKYAIEIDARSHNVSSEMLSTSEVLRTILTAFWYQDSVLDERVLRKQTEAGGVTSEEAALIEIYREKMRDKENPVFVLLDNVPPASAASAGHSGKRPVDPLDLLPPPESPSLLLITSRECIPGLADSHCRLLNRWGTGDIAEYLFQRRLYSADRTERNAADIGDATSGYPLLVELVTSLFQETSTFSWAKLAADVQRKKLEMSRRLKTASVDATLRALVEVSLELSRCNAERLQTLAVFTLHFDAAACANLWECEPEWAEADLKRFEALGFVRVQPMASVTSYARFRVLANALDLKDEDQKALLALGSAASVTVEELRKMWKLDNEAAAEARIDKLRACQVLEPVSLPLTAYRMHDRLREVFRERLEETQGDAKFWENRKAFHYLALMSTCNDLTLHRPTGPADEIDLAGRGFELREIGAALFRNEERNFVELSEQCSRIAGQATCLSHRLMHQARPAKPAEDLELLRTFAKECDPESAPLASLLGVLGPRVCDQFMGAKTRQTLVEAALVGAIALENPIHQAIHFVALGLAHRHQGHRLHASFYFNQGLDLFDRFQASPQLAKDYAALCERGIACARGNLGNMATEEMKSIREVPRAKRTADQHAELRKLLQAAEAHHLHARSLSGYHGWNLELGIDEGNLAIIYQIGWEENDEGATFNPDYDAAKIFAAAIELFTSRIAAGKRTNDLRGMANGFGNRANANVAFYLRYKTRGSAEVVEAKIAGIMADYDEALLHHRRCGNQRGVAASLLNRGRAISLLTMRTTESYNKSREHYLKALRIFRSEGDIPGHYTCLKNLAYLAHSHGGAGKPELDIIARHFEREGQRFCAEHREFRLDSFTLPKARKDAVEVACLADRYGKLLELTPHDVRAHTETQTIGARLLTAKGRILRHYTRMLPPTARVSTS